MNSILNTLIRNRLSLILLIITPLILLVGFYNLMKLTVEEIDVPIVFVDQAQQPIVTDLIKELQDTEPFSIKLEEEVPWGKLQRGEVEAVFSFANDTLERIYEGKTDDLITWYRHEQSVFDGLIKEQIAANIVNYVVRAEAANIVTNYNDSSSWDEVYNYGLKYLGPDPIFKMNFSSYKGTTLDDDKQQSTFPLIRLMIWIYCMVVISMFAKKLITWRSGQIYERLQLIPYSLLRLKLTWLLFVALVCSIVAAVILHVLYFNLENVTYSFSLLSKDLLIILISAILVLLGTQIFQRFESFIACYLTYTVFSTIVFILLQTNILNNAWWTYIFVPTWILT
ncbi:ABC transporter permease [Bacillaceae bacterium W0354]